MDRTEEEVEAYKAVVAAPADASDTQQAEEREKNRRADSLLKLNTALRKLGRAEEGAEYVVKAMDILPDHPLVQKAFRESQAAPEDDEAAGGAGGATISSRVETEKEDGDEGDDE